MAVSGPPTVNLWVACFGSTPLVFYMKLFVCDTLSLFLFILQVRSRMPADRGLNMKHEEGTFDWSCHKNVSDHISPWQELLFTAWLCAPPLIYTYCMEDLEQWMRVNTCKVDCFLSSVSTSNEMLMNYTMNVREVCELLSVWGVWVLLQQTAVKGLSVWEIWEDL